MIDKRTDKKVSMNRQPLKNSSFFAIRKNKVKWPTLRKLYMNDQNVEVLKQFVTSKGRSIVFLDGQYLTKLNRYAGKAPEERAVFWEFMVKEKGIKGGIFLVCWLGNFHNGAILHIAPQFPQIQCWYEALGYEETNRIFEKHSFKLYQKVAEILSQGQPIVDKEVQDFLDNGVQLIADK